MILPPIVLGTFLLGLVLALSAALGQRMFRLFNIPLESGQRRALLASGLGLGMLQFLPFALLACGIGSSTGIRIGTLALTVLLAPDLFAVVRAAMRLPTNAKHAWDSSQAWQRFLALVLAALTSAVYIRALCPITDDDGLSYHLAGALRWLAAGQFEFLPTLTYTNWPSGTEMLIVLLRGLHPDAPVGIIQFTYGTLILAAVFALARRMGGSTHAWTALVLLLVYKVFWEEMPQAHVDLGTALFATLAVLALHVSIRNPQSAIRNLSAVFAGLAASCKLNGMWIVAAMAVVVALTPPNGGSVSFNVRIRQAIAYFAIGIAVVAPWLLRCWVVTGNPLYPMFFGIFGGREWSAEGWPRIQRYFLLMNTPPGLSPTNTVLLLSRASLVLIAALVAALVYRRTRNSDTALPARYAFTFIPLLFLSSGYNLRFLLPAYPCVIVSASAVLSPLLFKPNKNQRIGSLVICVVATILSYRIGVNGLEPKLSSAISIATGRTYAAVYLREMLADYPAVEFANAKLPPESRILVGTWEESTAYYRSMALRSNGWLQDSVHYDSAQRLDSDLSRLGVTHLVFKPMEPDWCSRSSVCNGRMVKETRGLEDLIRRRGDKLFEANNVALYGLRPPISNRN